MLGKIEGRRRGRQRTRWLEDEMVRWHHRFSGYKFEQGPGDGEGGETWYHAVHGVTKSLTRLSD